MSEFRGCHLVLIRHAEAQVADGLEDIERHLTEAGQKQARELGLWLKENHLLPDVVICSPAVRTRETWAQIVESTGSGVLIEFEERIYEADVKTLVQVVREADVIEPARIAVVGHAPGIPTLAYVLDDGQSPLRDDLTRGFDPASVAVIELDVPLADVAEGTGRLTTLKRS